jgi:hypothetical protein
MSLSPAAAFGGAGAGGGVFGYGIGMGTDGLGVLAGAAGASASPFRSERTSEKMSFEVSGEAAASCAVSMRIVFAPRSDASSASRTAPTSSSSLNGRARMSNAPTFCASALRLVPR